MGVLGGTFDPVHVGHLRTVLDVKQALLLSEVRLIPNAVPPHRSPPVLEAKQRFQLLQKAIADLPGLVADEREIIRKGPSYMVDTLEDLKQQFADKALCLIIGMDAFNGFCSWHRWQDILLLAHLVVMQRAGIDKQTNHQLDECIVTRVDSLSGQASGQVLIQAVCQLEISSTRIRQMVSQGEDIHFLVPEVIRTEVATLYKG